MLPYTAYLRTYEPVTAFPEPLRSVWTAYAESSRRPRRARALEAEHAEAVRRLAAAPPRVAPEVESPHAYVRRVDDMIYIAPWETRLRSWQAFERLREQLRPGVADAFLPAPEAGRAVEEFERWRQGGRRVRPHILSGTWQVPLEWFVPFDPSERYLQLGGQPGDGAGGAGRPGEPGAAGELACEERACEERACDEPACGEAYSDPRADPRAGRGEPESGVSVPSKAPHARTLIYVTAMGDARRRVDEAVRALRGRAGEGLVAARVELLGEWLAQFHPLGLVELDYGGLVHLIDDDTLRADESVHEVSVALAATRRGEEELTVAMYKRLRARWRAVQTLESAN